MPVRKAWDHTIDLQEEFVSRKGRIYPLSRIERKKVQAFVDSQFKKGYIQLSKSPQTSPIMFVSKKNSVRVANSKPESSQLFFISIRQRKLVKSPRCIGLSTYTDSTWSVH